MNKRIRELVRESHLDVYGLGKDRDKWEHTIEKFAELIVKEHLGIWDLMDNGNDVEGYIEMEDYPNAIIKHFGLRKINDDLSKTEEFENWCRESDDGAEEKEPNSRFHNFAEGICESYQASIIDDINAQIAANPELVTPADEEQLDRLDKLLVNVECKTHPDAPHGFSRNASHNADRYVCECEHWEEPK